MEGSVGLEEGQFLELHAVLNHLENGEFDLVGGRKFIPASVGVFVEAFADLILKFQLGKSLKVVFKVSEVRRVAVMRDVEHFIHNLRSFMRFYRFKQFPQSHVHFL